MVVVVVSFNDLGGCCGSPLQKLNAKLINRKVAAAMQSCRPFIVVKNLKIKLISLISRASEAFQQNFDLCKVICKYGGFKMIDKNCVLFNYVVEELEGV